jgi:hypothetical protein
MGSSGRAELVTRKPGLADESALARVTRCGMYRWAMMYRAETVIWWVCVRGAVPEIRGSKRTHLEIILDLLDIVLEERRREDPGSVEEDAFGLAEGGVSVVERLAEGGRVGDVDCVGPDVDLSADSLLDGGFLSGQGLGAAGDQHDVGVALGGEEGGHSAADARAGADDEESLT